MTPALHNVAPMNEPKPDLIYKILTTALWEQVGPEDDVPGMPIDIQDGYMHFSTAAQLRETLRLHFKGQKELMLLAVRVEEVGDALKWEVSRGGAAFPHLYAPLAAKQVSWSAPTSVSETGDADLPELA